MMKKTGVLVALIAVGMVATGAASQHEQAQEKQVGPGMIDAASPLYGLETAWDNTAMSIGLKKAGDVAQERAAEAEKALEQNNSKAAARAAKEVGNVANKAKAGDSEGIDKAMSKMDGVMQKMEQRIQDAPNDEARQGMQTALENMQQAKSHMQEAKQRAAQGQENAPDQAGQAQDGQDTPAGDREQGQQENEQRSQHTSSIGSPDDTENGSQQERSPDQGGNDSGADNRP